MGTISKALSLLNYFSDSVPEIGLVEFEKLTGQNKATVHRHLRELEASGYLEQNDRTKKYRLGAAVLRLASVREQTFPVRKIVEESVDRLALQVRELVHASLIHSHAKSYVMSPICFRDYGKNGTRVYFSEAEILPVHATASGLAALAFGVPSILETTLTNKLERYTDATVVDKDALIDMVSATRRRGFSQTDQSYEAEVCSVAVPFYEDGDFATGSIAIALPASRMNKKAKSRFVTALWQTAQAISMELGGSVPGHVRQIWKSAA
ncbi:MAG: IclR family transcriptional regulator [Pseudomonadota bacterium]